MKKKKTKSGINCGVYYGMCFWVLVFVSLTVWALVCTPKQPTECPKESVVDTCLKECQDGKSNKVIVSGINFKMVCLCEDSK